MQKVLLIYSTNSGSTFVAGQIIKEILEKDFDVKMQNVVESKPEDIKNYSTVILGSPSWLSRGLDGMPTEEMLKLLDAWKKENFSDKNFSIYGCGDDGFIHFCGAVGYMEDFVNSTGGKFTQPSLRLNSFWFELDKNVVLTKKWANDLLKKLSAQA